MGFQILIIEDDQLLASYLADIVSSYHRPFIAHSLEKAQETLKNIKPDLVFTDLNLSPDIAYEGLQVVELCKDMDIPSVVLTSHAEDEVIREAFIKGCSHYVVKDEFEEEVEKIIKMTLGDPSEKFLNQNLKTSSEDFHTQVKHMLERSSNRDLPILLTGETGVGKTHLAQLIHRYHNETAPFVAKNLTELSSTVIESELFGHKKGAFTGALEDRKGLIEMAAGGTLFLDEIGALPLALQQKLLKVIEEKSFTPVGSNKEMKVDFRLITATCENLQEKIANGEFRVDFYFRIKGIEMTIPTLSQRIEDIDMVIKEFNQNQSRKVFLTDDALTTLKEHSWPGNFRELYGVLKSIYSGPKSMIDADEIGRFLCAPNKNEKDLSEYLTPKISSDILAHGLPEAIKKIEAEMFKKIVSLNGMKPNKICETLQISKSVFYRLQSQWESTHG